MVRGVFFGELLELTETETGKYLDFKLGQARYERPVLCSARREDFPGAIKTGDRVRIEGAVRARVSKAGNAYATLFVHSISLDLDALAASDLASA